MKYSLTWLIEEIQKGNQFDFLFFWGHSQKEISKIDKSCFSQWFLGCGNMKLIRVNGKDKINWALH